MASVSVRCVSCLVLSRKYTAKHYKKLVSLNGKGFLGQGESQVPVHAQLPIDTSKNDEKLEKAFRNCGVCRSWFEKNKQLLATDAASEDSRKKALQDKFDAKLKDIKERIADQTQFYQASPPTPKTLTLKRKHFEDVSVVVQRARMAAFGKLLLEQFDELESSTLFAKTFSPTGFTFKDSTGEEYIIKFADEEDAQRGLFFSLWLKASLFYLF